MSVKNRYLVAKVTGSNHENSPVDMFVLELNRHTLKRLRYMAWLASAIHLVLRFGNFLVQFFPIAPKKRRLIPFHLIGTGFQSMRFEFWGMWFGYDPPSFGDDDESNESSYCFAEVVDHLLPGDDDWGVFCADEIEAEYPGLLALDGFYGVRGHAVKVWHDGDAFFTSYDKHSGDDYETYCININFLLRAVDDGSLFERLANFLRSWRKFNQAQTA